MGDASRSMAARAQGDLILGIARNHLFQRYLLVAILKVVVDFAAFNALIVISGDSGWESLLAANSGGFLLAGWIAYRLNASFVFRVERRRGDFARFLAISIVGGLFYNGALLAIVGWSRVEGALELNVAKALALGASGAWNFVGYAKFVFRGQPLGKTPSLDRQHRDAA